MFSKNNLEVQVLCEEFYKALSQFQNIVTFNKKVDVKNISSAFDMLDRRYPEIFWLNGYSVKYDDKSAEVTFKVLNNYSADTLRKMQNALKQKVQAALKTTNKFTAYEKILAVHDYLVLHTDYQKLASKNRTIRHTAYGCLVEGKAVCEGYSKAFQLLMKHFNIECGICSGTARNESHAWNYVKLGMSYYWIDVTWDDPVYHGRTSSFEKWVQHNYFLINDELLFRTRKLSKSDAFVPSCHSLKENYFVKNKLYFKNYQFSDVDKLLTAHLKDGRIEMMFDDKKSYQTAVKDLFEKKTFWNSKIFEAKNGRKGGSVNYQTDDDLYILRILFKVNP